MPPRPYKKRRYIPQHPFWGQKQYTASILQYAPWFLQYISALVFASSWTGPPQGHKTPHCGPQQGQVNLPHPATTPSNPLEHYAGHLLHVIHPLVSPQTNTPSKTLYVMSTGQPPRPQHSRQKSTALGPPLDDARTRYVVHLIELKTPACERAASAWA